MISDGTFRVEHNGGTLITPILRGHDQFTFGVPETLGQENYLKHS